MSALPKLSMIRSRPAPGSRIVAVVAVCLTVCVAYWLGLRSTLIERDSLKAMVTALREEGSGCAVENDGRKVICWMEAGTLRAMPLRPNDLIVSRDCLNKNPRRKQSCAR